MDEDDDRRDRAGRKELGPPPGLFSWNVAHRHVMDVCGVSPEEARRLLLQARAEGRIRAEYILATALDSPVSVRHSSWIELRLPPPRTVHKFAGYNAGDVWREFPPTAAPGLTTVAHETKARTKLKLPVVELKAELRRRHQAEKLEPSWPREANELSKWADTALPGRPAAANTIRLNKELQDEYRELTGQRYG